MVEIGSKIDEVRIDGRLDPLRRDLNEFNGLELEAVELPVHGLDAVVHGRLHHRRLEELKTLLWDYGFAYTVHAPNPLNLMDDDNRTLHESVFRASLEFASEIGAGVVVYHAGRYVSEERFAVPGYLMLSEEERRDLLDREARAVRDLADEYPAVCICIENARPYLYHSPYCYAENPRELLEQVVRIARPNVRINLDVGHLYLAAGHYGFDPVEAAAEIREFVAHVHVHDNFGLPVYYTEKQQTHLVPFGRGDAHMPVGWGEVPIGAILKTFAGSYDGLMITELRSRYFDYTKESVENLKAILRNLQA
ncbi:MAG: sugar phosphate isomerase/epimerase [Syntrophaceae bacterium]|nr:sugar phosphate isomerase/epimerase [Syntrophaceae bacterium]